MHSRRMHPIPSHPIVHSRPPQILLFSATFNERVKRFAQKIVPDANQAGAGWGFWCRVCKYEWGLAPFDPRSLYA